MEGAGDDSAISTACLQWIITTGTIKWETDHALCNLNLSSTEARITDATGESQVEWCGENLRFQTEEANWRSGRWAQRPWLWIYGPSRGCSFEPAEGPPKRKEDYRPLQAKIFQHKPTSTVQRWPTFSSFSSRLSTATFFSPSSIFTTVSLQPLIISVGTRTNGHPKEIVIWLQMTLTRMKQLSQLSDDIGGNVTQANVLRLPMTKRRDDGNIQHRNRWPNDLVGTKFSSKSITKRNIFPCCGMLSDCNANEVSSNERNINLDEKES